jgi:dUTP pyrophosphatase
MRGFEFVTTHDENGNVVKAFPDARLPEYGTKHSAGADFYCAQNVVIPSIWEGLARNISCESSYTFLDPYKADSNFFKPTLVHTGIRADMYDHEVLEIFNRSSNPGRGLILANSVGIIDKDYYSTEDNRGEIMFAYINISPYPVELQIGDKVGQGIFTEFKYPDTNTIIHDVDRNGCGFGSTGK